MARQEGGAPADSGSSGRDHVMQELEIQTTARFHVVRFRTSDLRNPNAIHAVESDLRALQETLERDCAIISFQNVEHAGSALFGIILHFAEAVEAQGKVVRLCDMEESVEHAFEIINASETVEVYEAIEDAADEPVRPHTGKPWWKFW